MKDTFRFAGGVSCGNLIGSSVVGTVCYLEWTASGEDLPGCTSLGLVNLVYFRICRIATASVVVIFGFLLWAVRYLLTVKNDISIQVN